MNRRLKRLVLSVLRVLGIFRLARVITQQHLRILCYHGVSILDEHIFRPGLFMRPETFTRRIKYLVRAKYPILPLNEALRFLRNGIMPAGATVITIDDGWYGTYSAMLPVLERYHVPATLYLSTYYFESQTQVFNVSIQYLLWKTEKKCIDLRQVDERLDGIISLEERDGCSQAVSKVMSLANNLRSAQERQLLFRSLAESLSLDWRQIEANRICAFINKREACVLLAGGVEIQLHTHRHRFPSNRLCAEAEITRNREALQDIATGPLRHFCYPSGSYEPHQLEWLPSLGIESAVTTRNGLNTVGCATNELRRFLDSDDISQIEFEAEIAGLMWLLRRAVYFLRGCG